MTKATINWQKVREDFPQLERQVHQKQLVYFDNAATTLKPKSVIRSMEQHLAHNVANIHRGVHFLSESGTAEYEKTRDKIQSFIKAKKREEIIFTKGTTEAINLVASSYVAHRLKKDDVILLASLEHHSNIVPWQMAAEKVGARIEEIPVLDTGDIDLSGYKKVLEQFSGKVKFVSMAHITNGMGVMNPIKECIELAHQAGAKFMVDGAQAVAHVELDVCELDCDFYAFSAHKMVGPTGFGVLYGKEELLDSMPPYQGGGDMIDVVTLKKTTYNCLPHKFEAGTPPIAEGIAFFHAISYLENIGLTAILEREHVLTHYLKQKLQTIEEVKIFGNPKYQSAIVPFNVRGAHHHDLGTLLDQQGIAVRTGHHCNQPLLARFGLTGTVRASLAFYNNEQEIDLFINALKKSLTLL